jgi:hypothetical protein
VVTGNKQFREQGVALAQCRTLARLRTVWLKLKCGTHSSTTLKQRQSKIVTRVTRRDKTGPQGKLKQRTWKRLLDQMTVRENMKGELAQFRSHARLRTVVARNSYSLVNGNRGHPLRMRSSWSYRRLIGKKCHHRAKDGERFPARNRAG